MEENNTVIEHPKKFTYEQLEHIATSLSSQVQQLGTRLQEANMFNTFKRLDYLFKVLEVSATSATMFSLEFIDGCTREIEEILTLPSPTEESPTEESLKEE